MANIEAGFVWAGDSSTLLYVAKNPVTLLSERVFRHALGTASAADTLVYEEKDESFYLSLKKSRSEQYLFIGFESTESSEWRYADAHDPRLDFRPVLPREPHLLYDVEHLGPDFILRTNHEAPNFRIVKAPVGTSADKRSWRDVLPHRPDAFLEDFEVAASHLIVNERSGGLLKIRVMPWPEERPDGIIRCAQAARNAHRRPGAGLRDAPRAHTRHRQPGPALRLLVPGHAADGLRLRPAIRSQRTEEGGPGARWLSSAATTPANS